MFGFIGPNGAGKTTSMRILATLDDAARGDALVDGFSVVDDPDASGARLGFMPDYFGTYRNMNVHEYLDFFARAYGLARRATAAQPSIRSSSSRARRAAREADRGPVEGHEAARRLGRTMVHDPHVLILDEPAAGLDPRARIELREMIRQLAADGKTILISSHILTELAEMCDRVAVIERGSSSRSARSTRSSAACASGASWRFDWHTLATTSNGSCSNNPVSTTSTKRAAASSSSSTAATTTRWRW